MMRIKIPQLQAKSINRKIPIHIANTKLKRVIPNLLCTNFST